MLSVTVNPGNPKVRDYTFYTCGIPVSAWLDCADKIQSALNGSIADISYGEDNQTVTLSLAPPATKWPERIVWYDRNVSLENFVLTLGESQLGPVTVDLRTNAHILLGGVTGSGKTVLLKVLLRQAIDKGARVYIADFKGGVDFKSWFRENCCMSYDMDTTLKTLAEWENELDRRKTLLRDSNCSNIDEYNAMFTETKLHRWAFACDEIAMMLDKTGQSKEQKEKIDKASAALSLLACQGRSFGLHLILATQRPDANVMPAQVRSNIDYRVCGRADSILSSIIIDSTAAAELIPKNAKGLFMLNDSSGRDTSATVFKSYILPDGAN